jgi:hypothetical protein
MVAITLSKLFSKMRVSVPAEDGSVSRLPSHFYTNNQIREAQTTKIRDTQPRRDSQGNDKGHWSEVLPLKVQTLGDVLCSLGASPQVFYQKRDKQTK